MRAYLGGRDVPREEFALLGIDQTSGAPAVLLLEDADVFVPEDYMSLGYTNFEAWCVGASGGRGGDAMDTVSWRTSKTQEVMPDSIWADVVAGYNAVNGPGYVYSGADNPANVTRPPVGVIEWDVINPSYVIYQLTPEGLAWLQNPTHIATITNYLAPIVQPGGKYIGGGGGGGGLHVVAGLLADLPESVVAEVGKVGADGAAGQSKQPAPYDPSPVYNSSSRDDLGHAISLARWNFLNRFPNGHPTVGLPLDGSPGGASSFGDVCQASGGSGGKPAIQWSGSLRQQYASGGEGGIGGSVTPGGGAAGAIVSNTTGKDGIWDGTIGAGGGGGRGGINPDVFATEGGRGSLSFADTSVYGARGPLGTYMATILSYDATSGNLISSVDTPIASNYNPGSGGGARIPGNRKYGGRATGYSHDGAVLIRLTKVG